MELIKKYWWVIIIGLLILPLLINVGYLFETEYSILHAPSAWTTFWATYLSAIASFTMIYFTWRTLREMQRQWSEANRARLTFAIVVYDGVFLLKITNCGTATAYNITVHFNIDFIENHFSNIIKDALQLLSHKPFCIEAGISKYYYISPTYTDGTCTIGGKEIYTSEEIKQWLDEHKSDKIEITGMYCDCFDIKEVFSIDEYINGGIIVRDDLSLAVERIKKGMVVQNTQYNPIQKSLHIIAENIVEIKKQQKDI